MTIQISFESVKRYDSHDDAERAIRCFLLPQGPPRHYYEVCEYPVRACRRSFFGVKAYRPDGRFAGYAYCPESEQ
jgi:hypothetical protein